MGDHLLGIQGHPEYTKDILFNLVDRLASQNLLEVWGLRPKLLRDLRHFFPTLFRGNSMCLQGDFVEDVKANIEAAEPDRRFWQNVCKSFLKGR